MKFFKPYSESRKSYSVHGYSTNKFHNTSFVILSLFCLWGIISTVSAKEPTQVINNESVLSSIQLNILIKDSQDAVTYSNQLSQILSDLKQDSNQKNLLLAQQQFIKLMRAWKRVEALYSAGNINSDFLDIPHYIDVYHTGNEDIYKQIDRGLESEKAIKTVLFKNSTKSINALEYVLFANNNSLQLLQAMKRNNYRHLHMAQLINTTINKYLAEIHQFYLDDFQQKDNQENKFVSQGKKSIEDLVNVLIDSSYKLLTWRVAEPAGLSDKYKGKPAVKHLEYYLSASSFLAIESILHSYQDILHSKQYLDLGDLGTHQGVAEEMQSVQHNITKTLEKNKKLINLMAMSDISLSQLLLTTEYLQLNQALIRLHNSFYILLIEALGLKSKIIEADGD